MRGEVRQYKRQRIAEEAVKLFYEHGYEATSLDMIAGKLGVTKPFIYSHFANKQAILVYVFEHFAEDLIERIVDKDMESKSPAVRLRDVVERYVRINIEFQIGSGVYLQEEKNIPDDVMDRMRAKEGEINDLLAGLIDLGNASGDFTAEDSHLASACLIGMIRWVHRWYKPDGPLTLDEIATNFGDLALNLVEYKPGNPQGNA